MNAFWGLGQLMFSKTIVVVDKDVNVHDVREVAWIVGTHMDPLRDIQMTKGPGRRSGRCGGSAGVRRQDGHRRDAQVGVRRLHAVVAGASQDDRSRRTARDRDLEQDRKDLMQQALLRNHYRLMLPAEIVREQNDQDRHKQRDHQ